MKWSRTDRTPARASHAISGKSIFPTAGPLGSGFAGRCSSLVHLHLIHPPPQRLDLGCEIANRDRSITIEFLDELIDSITLRKDENHLPAYYRKNGPATVKRKIC